MAYDWSDERIARMSELWRKGSTASQVAAELGGGVTRNAVIGKLHRLGLMNRAQDAAIVSRTRAERIRREEARMARPAPPPRPMPKPAAPMPKPVVVVSMPETEGDGVDIAGLNDRICKYPLGPMMARAERFCGEPADGPKSYCAHHHAVCYTPIERKPILKRDKPRASSYGFFRIAAE